MGYTINDTESRYNGWTNYATWRVNLEIFDCFDYREHFTAPSEGLDVSELVHYLKDYADSIITMDNVEGLAVDYARAFMANVNWREIAEHMVDAIKSEAA